jgi:hypothetical protein
MMLCHECVMVGDERPPVAICEYCKVLLCKEHLIALYCDRGRTPPFMSCGHNRAGRPAATARRVPTQVRAAS